MINLPNGLVSPRMSFPCAVNLYTGTTVRVVSRPFNYTRRKDDFNHRGELLTRYQELAKYIYLVLPQLQSSWERKPQKEIILYAMGDFRNFMSYRNTDIWESIITLRAETE